MKKLLLLAIIIILIPLLLVGINHKEEIAYKIKYGSINNKVIKVKRTKKNTIEDVALEQYVLGVVAGEMPATFNIEALKAQAVASRTYALKKTMNNNEYDVEDGTNSQVFIDDLQMKEKWQNNYDNYIKKIKQAVEATKGEVILYNNDLIDAMFFSTSNGYTENSENVFSSALPYLVSVESSWDKEESPAFYSKKEIPKKEFLFNLGLLDSSDIDISDVERSSSGRVKTIKINKKEFKGTEIRKIFNLKSTSFKITLNESAVIFEVNGYGHGVGMSQYGANGMAKEGYDYQEILKHYYKDTEIKKIN